MKKDIVIVNFRVAVKAFIVKDNKLFIIKREEKDIQSPNIWEIPGGRLELGEDPYLGLIREIREETGMLVEILYPLSVRHFMRDDGQVITMIIFLCKPQTSFVKLSSEHSKFEWEEIEKSKEKLTEFFHEEIDLFNKLELKRLFSKAENNPS